MINLVKVQEGGHVRLFNTISVEVASRCNRHCHFCPNGYHDREDKFMEWDIIKKIIGELKELKYKGRITWYNYNEPTRDKRLPDIMKYCREQLPGVCQMINTNGDYFKSKDDIKKYFEAGLNQMQINVYSAYDDSESEEQFEKGIRLSKKRELLFNKWVDELVKEGALERNKTMYTKISVNKRYINIVPKYGIKKGFTGTGVDGFTNRSGNIPDFKEAVNHSLNKSCVRPFRMMYIDYNGQSTLCCNDYHSMTNFGNIRNKTLVEMWNSLEMNIYRLKLQNKDRQCYLCNKCDFNGGSYPGAIDHVTFGKEIDAKILKADLTKRSSIFTGNSNEFKKSLIIKE